MKKITSLSILLAFILLAAFRPYQQTELKSIPVNSQLAYNVDFKGEKYQFMVEVLKKTPELVFKYNLTMGGGMNATVTIGADAMKNAVNQNNYFNGRDISLTNQTTVWVSQKVFNDIITTGKTTMGDAQGLGVKTTEYSLVGKEKFSTTLNGDAITLEALHLKATNDSGFEYWIWNNAADPLILKMQLGWGIAIKEINVN